jgi:hypothetical protein
VLNVAERGAVRFLVRNINDGRIALAYFLYFMGEFYDRDAAVVFAQIYYLTEACGV